MQQFKIILVFVLIQSLLVALQWWLVPPDSALNFVSLAVSALVLPTTCGWRLGRVRTPVAMSTASGALLTLAWIGTGYIAHWITGEPDAEVWGRVVSLAFSWLLTFQLAFAYVGGNRGFRKATNAA
jgi:hypothetical protein